MNLTAERTRIRMSMREANMLREVRESLKRIGIRDCRVTNVSISSDWRYARIYCVSTTDMDDKHAVEILEASAFRISKMVRNRCGGHFFPTLRFSVDEEARRVQRVEDLLSSIPDVEDGLIE